VTWSADAVTVAGAVTLFLLGCRLLRVIYHLSLMSLALTALPFSPPALRDRSMWRRYARHAPPIAILAPAFNEERTVIESVTSLLRQDYPNLEIVVINDGSRDDTLKLLTEHFDLAPVERNYNQWVEHAPINALYGSSKEPRLLVVDKVNGGSKADAINAGINVARSSLICIIDTDSLIEPDALQRLVRPFIQDPQATIAVGGAVRVINGCKVADGRVVEGGLPRNLLARFQTLEYLRAFLFARVTLSRLGLLTIVSGAFGLFDRRVLLEVGGYSLDTCGEDLELIVKMHRHMREQGARYRIAYLADPVCWTEVPEALHGLASQRRRWERGSIETILKHRTMAFNPRYGRIGFVSLPLIMVADLAGPLLAVLSYVLVPLFWATGLLNTLYFQAFIGTALSFGVFVSASTLIIDELEFRQFRGARELVMLALVAVAENFGYRQLNNVWRLRGIYDFFRGTTVWEDIPRQGFGRSA
jgi:cellulose synthase/poly-beta-1,6-N-acetylglucosamine synthase-like glycosyltransferase